MMDGSADFHDQLRLALCTRLQQARNDKHFANTGPEDEHVELDE